MKKDYFYIMICLMGTLVNAQISFKAVPSKTEVEVGERLMVSYVVESNESVEMKQLTFPNFTGFQMIGHNVGKSTKIINGEVNRQYVETVVLMPQQPGKYKFGGASITIDGKKYNSNTLQIIVSKSSQKATPIQGGQIAFLDVDFSKDQVYPNEPITAKVKLYAKSYDALRKRTDLNVPLMADFQVKEISKNTERNFEQVSINNEIYISEEIAELQLIPKKSGELLIPEFQLRVVIPIDMFDEKMLSIKSNEKIIDVKKFPANAPNDFSGAVGDFRLESHLDKVKVQTNESVNYEVELIGEGNLAGISLPKINSVQDLELYPAKTRNAFQTSMLGQKGKIVDKYVLVPQFGGTFTIEPVSFCFFNPKDAKYKTISTQPIQLVVDGVTKDQKIAKDSASSIIDSKDNSQDILPNIQEKITNIITETTDVVEGNGKSGNYGWLALLALPILAGLGWFVWKKRKSTNSSDEVKVQKDSTTERFDSKQLIKKVEAIKKLANSNHKEEYLSESNQILNQSVNYIAADSDYHDVLDSKRIITTKRSLEMADEWEKVYNQTQMMKYGIASTDLAYQEHYESLEKLIKYLAKKA